MPSNFKQLQYIESTGTQYINTGLNGNMSYTYELDFQQIDTGNYRNWGVFGQSVYSGKNMSMTYCNGGFCVRWESRNGNVAAIDLGTIDTARHLLKIDNGTVYFDGISKGKTEGHQNDFKIDYPVFLGTVNPAGATPSYNAKSKYYSYTVKDSNGNVLQNLVPARRVSDEVLGMYDTVSDTFKTNAGTGTFTAGPEF